MATRVFASLVSRRASTINRIGVFLVSLLSLSIANSPRALADRRAPVANDKPRSDQSSGIAIPRDVPNYHFANRILAVPRAIAGFLLRGPRLAAGEVDDYLEAKSPNAYGRTEGEGDGTVRLGLTAEWETTLGPSLAIRGGYGFGPERSIDLFTGFLGPRGLSTGIRSELGEFSDAKLRPTVAAEIGRGLEGRFSGTGDDAGGDSDPGSPYRRGPRAAYQVERFAVSGRLRGDVGPLDIALRSRLVFSTATDDDPSPLSENFRSEELFGFDETVAAMTTQLEVTLDRRTIAHSWIPAAAPSSGYQARFIVGYLRGAAERSGNFASTIATVDATRLFDLYRGDRVLSIRGRLSAISSAADSVPFDALPSLGGRQFMKALPKGEYRDRLSTYAELKYEWSISRTSRAYLFVETGAVHPGLSDIALDRLHVAYGGGIRFIEGASTSSRFQIAGSENGDIGFFLRWGLL